LRPNDDVERWNGFLSSSRSTMLVGHMPFLGDLSCEMTGGEVYGWNTEFRTAEVACFEQVSDLGWKLIWHLSPEDI
jgi:phosphohistidine phosphatase SixA